MSRERDPERGEPADEKDTKPSAEISPGIEVAQPSALTDDEVPVSREAFLQWVYSKSRAWRGAALLVFHQTGMVVGTAAGVVVGARTDALYGVGAAVFTWAFVYWAIRILVNWFPPEGARRLADLQDAARVMEFAPTPLVRRIATRLMQRDALMALDPAAGNSMQEAVRALRRLEA